MGSISPESFDFIVVGAGPAGVSAAIRLARTPQHPSVLLIEAGGRNDAKSLRVDAERWLTRMNPPLNWGYKSIPQMRLLSSLTPGRQIEFDRGKGLGGSSAINFSVWTLGASDDWDEIARIVGDDQWRWSNAQRLFKRIEAFYSSPDDIPSGSGKYLSPLPENHGSGGPVKVGFPVVWERSLTTTMDAMLEAGLPANPDHNSGNPIGLAVAASSAYKGLRSTAADGLMNAPENLKVMIDTEVARVIFNGKRATGIETIGGAKIVATQEVILSCGALDTPRVLLHSGIGPRGQLEEFGIPIVQANAHVGQHLRDHHHMTLTYARAEHTTDRHIFYRSKELQEAARAQWDHDQTGRLAEIATALGIGYLKNDKIVESAEFESLSEDTKRYLKQPTVPHWEVIFNGPSLQHFIDPENAPALDTVFLCLMNTQSTGSATLQSSDPKVPLLFDPRYLTHPFDRRLAVETTRQLLKTLNHRAYSKDTVSTISAPKSESEQDILQYWEQETSSTWHMTGTAVMGRNVEEAVVDKDFKVFGVDGLRVADMSIYPIVTK